jgi:hypothetical protein
LLLFCRNYWPTSDPVRGHEASGRARVMTRQFASTTETCSQFTTRAPLFSAARVAARVGPVTKLT